MVPDDLKGLKIRVPKSPSRVTMFKAWGAAPTPMSFGEVFSALQQGVIDGQENPFTDIYAGKLYEVQKYLSLTNHVYTPAYLITGKTYWEKLPADIQKIMAEAALEAQGFIWNLGAQMDKELIVKLEKTMKVNQANVQAFQKASKPIYERLSEEVGADFLKRAMEVIRQ